MELQLYEKNMGLFLQLPTRCGYDLLLEYGALSRCGWLRSHIWIAANESSYTELSAPESK